MKNLTAVLFAIVITASARAGIDMQTPTSYVATTSTGSTAAVAQNSARKAIIVQNRGSVKVYMKFDSAFGVATPPTDAVEIAALGNYSESCAAPTDSIFLKSDSSTALVVVYEGTGDCTP